MPFFIAFFVLSGASLHLDSLAHLGILGTVYLLARPIGKAIGAWIGGRATGEEKKVYGNLGLGLLPQAGVAIGLMLTVQEDYPEVGRVIETVILASIVIYEGLGPYLTKLALGKADEVRDD
jgi:Kef-type K+ transport system membrane component KefB